MEISSSSEEKERKSYLERIIHRLSRSRRRSQEADDQAQAYAEFTQREQERARQRERIVQQSREKEAYEIWAQENPEQVRLNQIAINKEKKAREKEREHAAEERHNQYQWVRQVGGGWIMEKIPPALTRQEQFELERRIREEQWILEMLSPRDRDILRNSRLRGKY
jgi:hypothetical protein